LVRREQEPNVSDYIAMGGYGAYVWSAFAVALLLMVGLFVQSRQAARKRDVELAELRIQVRPSRPRAARPMRPRREIEPAGSSVPEGG
jgi:heme exporter protein CcmD